MKSIEIPYSHRANRRKNPRPSVTNFVGSFGAARSRRIIRRGSQTCQAHGEPKNPCQKWMVYGIFGILWHPSYVCW